MSVRVLQGLLETSVGAVMYDSVTMWAFGPVFADTNEALDFIEWCEKDPRAYTPNELENKYTEWRSA